MVVGSLPCQYATYDGPTSSCSIYDGVFHVAEMNTQSQGFRDVVATARRPMRSAQSSTRSASRPRVEDDASRERVRCPYLYWSSVVDDDAGGSWAAVPGLGIRGRAAPTTRSLRTADRKRAECDRTIAPCRD